MLTAMRRDLARKKLEARLGRYPLAAAPRHHTHLARVVVPPRVAAMVGVPQMPSANNDEDADEEADAQDACARRHLLVAAALRALFRRAPDPDFVRNHPFAFGLSPVAVGTRDLATELSSASISWYPIKA